VNVLRVTHRLSEFFLAFGQLGQEQGAQGHLLSSLTTSPAHAKLMLDALARSVAAYEEHFGTITVEGLAEGQPTPRSTS
jgi:hypothetical protein